jgi:Na+-driven multidrug efflux pump
MLLSMRALFKFRGAVRLKWHRIRPYVAEIKEILLIGVPAGLQQGLYSIANVVITATVNSVGADAATGIGIANQFDNILYQISVAPALAVMPYVSQNVAAGKVKRASRSVALGMLITVSLGASFGALSAIFSPQLSSLMSDSAAVIEYSCQKMMIISSTYFICGINEIMGASLRGLGKPIVPTVSTLVYLCALRFVWVYLIFPPFFPNLTVLFLVWPIGWVLSIFTLLLFYLPAVRSLACRTQA